MLGPEAAGVSQLQDLIQRLINLSVGLAFIALVVMLTWGGFKLLTSGGDPKALSSAGQTFTWTLLGILFMVIAWLIIKIISAFTGVDLTHFCLGFAPLCTWNQLLFL